MPFGLEFALILAALAIVVFVACALPVMFQLRRRMLRSLLLAEHTKGRVDLLLDECRRSARRVGDFADRAGAWKPYRAGVFTFLKSLLTRPSRDHSRKETRYV
ncbi:MAG TPA: hypothetical protein VFB67_11030 [Candidatus Polarisedimenticolaceae bacterium]|nr:hypothetical protein [Candidatus Polarisedimenticolaceae bacterium]